MSGNDDHQQLEEFRREVSPRRSFTPRHQKVLFGYCFSCNNFSNKAIDCREYARSDHVRNESRGSYKISKDDNVKNSSRSS